MKKLLLFLVVILAFMFFVFYDQALIANKSHIVPNPQVTTDESIDLVINAYANSITAQVPAGKPVVMFVPLNGFPDSTTHLSYKNAQVALAVLNKVKAEQKYILFSEGYTGSTCLSGAQATALMLSMNEGYNSNIGVSVLLEPHAKTTLENIRFSKNILKSTFVNEDAYLVVAGMTDEDTIENLDVGHGARAFMLAKQNYASLPHIHVIGLLPTTEIDKTIISYTHAYNFQTMFLGANGVLNLPFFNKKFARKPIAGCPDAK